MTSTTRASAIAFEGGAQLSPEQRLEAYRWMVTARLVDERCLSLQRQGRIGFYAPLSGQEAAQVGAALAVRPEDWIFPAYRELAVALVRGVTLSELFDQMVGNSRDHNRGRQMPNHFGYRAQHFVSASSPIGTQITQAVGAAMAAQRRHDPIATVAFFGDGATSSNDFHAGLNFAGVFRAPTVFFCQNNQWAISLPRERQTRSATLAEKAAAYGFRAVGGAATALGAVYRAVGAARPRAATGGGPTLIEAQVYRFGPHSTSDDPHRYRADAEVAEARHRDPIERLRAELRAAGTLSEAADQQLWEAAKGEIAAAFEGAEQVPPPAPTSLFEDVFASPTPRLEEERRQYDARASRGGTGP